MAYQASRSSETEERMGAADSKVPSAICNPRRFLPANGAPAVVSMGARSIEHGRFRTLAIQAWGLKVSPTAWQAWVALRVSCLEGCLGGGFVRPGLIQLLLSDEDGFHQRLKTLASVLERSSG